MKVLEVANWVSELGVVQYTGGINKLFELLNWGKQSVAVNLENSQGQEIVQKLAAESDVVITKATLTHAKEGDFKILTPPIKYARTPGKPRSAAPELGQDTETTLLELGYTWDDVIILKEQGAII